MNVWRGVGQDGEQGRLQRGVRQFRCRVGYEHSRLESGGAPPAPPGRAHQQFKCEIDLAVGSGLAGQLNEVLDALVAVGAANLDVLLQYREPGPVSQREV